MLWLGGRPLNISCVKLNISSEDLFGIISEYVKIEGLNINNIIINELVTVYGTYKKGITIPFKLEMGIGNVCGNLIHLKLFSIKIGKIGILKSIRNNILKKLLKDFHENGIDVDKDNIIVNLDIITKAIPYFNVKLRSIKLLKDEIEVELNNVAYEKNKEVMEFNKKTEEIVVKTTKDNYSKIRGDIKEKVPDKYKDIMEYAMILPDLIALIFKLLKDERVPLKNKILLGGVIAYIVSPIDLILNFIPFIGQIDDLALVFFALNIIINETKEEIILCNWEGKEDIILIIRSGVKYLINIIGENNVKRVIDILKKKTIVTKQRRMEE